MYKENVAFNNPQMLICHKTQLNQTNMILDLSLILFLLLLIKKN